MKLIIELSNGTVYRVKKKDRFTWGTLDELKEAIKKGKPLQTELEKIKAEIIACTQQEEGEVPACINYGIKLSTEIVEKHISKLKGETNEIL